MRTRRLPSPGLLLAAAMLPALAAGQGTRGTFGGSGSSGSYASRGSHPSGHGEFPSWERDVSVAELDPLPQGPTGKHAVAFVLEVGHVPTGVAATGDGHFAVAMDDGVVQFRDAAGEIGGEIDLDAALAHPPVAARGGVLVAGPGLLALVSSRGVAWRRDGMPAALHAPPVVHGPLVLTVSDGQVEATTLDEGRPAWVVPVAGVATAPAAWGDLVFVGTSDGDVAALRDGQLAWREKVADRVDGLAADGTSVHVAGFGRTHRSRKDRGPVALRLGLPKGGLRPGRVEWALRLGGPCAAPPFYVDDLVAFPSGDGYLHALERRRGIQGWRTDLPSRCRVVPAWTGSRLDFALGPARYLVSLAPGNGAVVGWTALEDEDDYFVGAPQRVGALTIVATRLQRVVAFRFEGAEPAPAQGADALRATLGARPSGAAPQPALD